MLQELHKLSDDAMQELLRIEMLQQIIDRTKTNPLSQKKGSPYYSEGSKTSQKHLALASRMLEAESKNKVRLHPKSEDELKSCLQTIEQQAVRLVNDEAHDMPDAVVKAAREATNSPATVDQLICFARLYYHSYLDGLLDKA